MSGVRITDAGLFIEAVRRLRGRPIPHSRPVAWSAVNPELLINGLSKLMTPHAMRDVCNALIKDGQVAVAARKVTYNDNAIMSDCTDGLVMSFHPDVPFKRFQLFTAHGTPCVRVPMRKKWVNLNALTIQGIYIISDGLPKKVVEYREKQQIVYP